MRYTPPAIDTSVPDEHNPEVPAMSAAEFERLRRENSQLRVAKMQMEAEMDRIVAKLHALVRQCTPAKSGGGQ